MSEGTKKDMNVEEAFGFLKGVISNDPITYSWRMMDTYREIGSMFQALKEKGVVEGIEKDKKLSNHLAKLLAKYPDVKRAYDEVNRLGKNVSAYSLLVEMLPDKKCKKAHEDIVEWLMGVDLSVCSTLRKLINDHIDALKNHEKSVDERVEAAKWLAENGSYVAVKNLRKVIEDEGEKQELRERVAEELIRWVQFHTELNFSLETEAPHPPAEGSRTTMKVNSLALAEALGKIVGKEESYERTMSNLTKCVTWEGYTNLIGKVGDERSFGPLLMALGSHSHPGPGLTEGLLRAIYELTGRGIVNDDVLPALIREWNRDKGRGGYRLCTIRRTALNAIGAHLDKGEREKVVKAFLNAEGDALGLLDRILKAKKDADPELLKEIAGIHEEAEAAHVAQLVNSFTDSGDMTIVKRFMKRRNPWDLTALRKSNAHFNAKLNVARIL